MHPFDLVIMAAAAHGIVGIGTLNFVIFCTFVASVLAIPLASIGVTLGDAIVYRIPRVKMNIRIEVSLAKIRARIFWLDCKDLAILWIIKEIRAAWDIWGPIKTKPVVIKPLPFFQYNLDERVSERVPTIRPSFLAKDWTPYPTDEIFNDIVVDDADRLCMMLLPQTA
jgi:hypothetical protein